jgi:putative membrane protein
MKRIALLSAVMLIAAPAFAQSVGEKSGVNSALGISPTTADFVKQVAISDMFELQSNKLAEERGNAAEKAFAAIMIKDHTKTSDELKALVKSGDVRKKYRPALIAATSKLDKLSGSEGPTLVRNFSRRSCA